ncbi:hypothetical protein C8J56DRAFT_1020144 [Mycena floridula]|nr:hypothetical protein C8J56DRAFT_1020144 [Mycena floridula]
MAIFLQYGNRAISGIRGWYLWRRTPSLLATSIGASGPARPYSCPSLSPSRFSSQRQFPFGFEFFIPECLSQRHSQPISRQSVLPFPLTMVSPLPGATFTTLLGLAPLCKEHDKKRMRYCGISGMGIPLLGSRETSLVLSGLYILSIKEEAGERGQPDLQRPGQEDVHPRFSIVTSSVPSSHAFCKQAFMTHWRAMTMILLPAMGNIVWSFVLEANDGYRDDGEEPGMQESGAARMSLEDVVIAWRDEGSDCVERRQNETRTREANTTPSPPPIDPSKQSPVDPSKPTVSRNTGPIFSERASSRSIPSSESSNILVSESSSPTTASKPVAPKPITIAVVPVLEPPRLLPSIPHVLFSLEAFKSIKLNEVNAASSNAAGTRNVDTIHVDTIDDATNGIQVIPDWFSSPPLVGIEIGSPGVVEISLEDRGKPLHERDERKDRHPLPQEEEEEELGQYDDYELDDYGTGDFSPILEKHLSIIHKVSFGVRETSTSSDTGIFTDTAAFCSVASFSSTDHWSFSRFARSFQSFARALDFAEVNIARKLVKMRLRERFGSGPEPSISKGASESSSMLRKRSSEELDDTLLGTKKQIRMSENGEPTTWSWEKDDGRKIRAQW